jgi:hypothetical protein
MSAEAPLNLSGRKVGVSAMVGAPSNHFENALKRFVLKSAGSEDVADQGIFLERPGIVKVAE